MSRKFFYNKVYNPQKQKMIIIAGAGLLFFLIIIILIIVISSSNNVYSCKDHFVEVKESVNVEINSELPEVDAYFNTLTCVRTAKIKVNSDDVDITKFGDYTLHLKVGKDSFDTTIKIVDNTPPDLAVKKLRINPGTKYTYNDFVQSCKDNSNTECIISFYNEGDANYTQIGSYSIKIAAKDANDNKSIVTTTLEITNEDLSTESSGSDNNTLSCENGDTSYDSSNYILTLNTTSNGCPSSKEAIEGQNLLAKINKIAETEAEKIKDQVNRISGLGPDIFLTKNITSVPNNSKTGYVGYSLFISVIDKNDNKNDVVVSYYLNADNTRSYLQNPHNIG